MRFSKHLYLSPNIRHPSVLKRRIKRGAGNLSAYVLIAPRDPDSGPQFEVMHCAFLQQRYYKETDPVIIGIAEGRWEALLLCRQIIQDVWDSTGTADARAWLSDRLKDEGIL